VRDRILKAAAEVRRPVAGPDDQSVERDGASVVVGVWLSGMHPGNWRVALAGDRALVAETAEALAARPGFYRDTAYPTLVYRP
jgi:hypothetical protein